MSHETVPDPNVRARIVEKLLRERAVRDRREQLETVVGWFPTDERDRVRAVLEEMVADPDSPVGAIGDGPYANVSVTDYETAKQYLDELGADTRWV